MYITHPLVGALSAALSPRQQNPCSRPAPPTVIVDHIAFDSADVAIANNNDNKCTAAVESDPSLVMSDIPRRWTRRLCTTSHCLTSG